MSSNSEKVNDKIASWRKVVVFGFMLVLVIGIPSLPRPHRFYWGIALILEGAVCITVLPFKPWR